MPKNEPPGPDTPSAAYEEMAPTWLKLETLLQGTWAMRDAERTYLPQHAEETDNAYRERLERSVLLNITAMTLDSWVGKPFSSPIHIGDDVPPQIKDLLDNVDLQGNSLNVFCRNWFRDGLAKGFSHVMVDFPRKPERPDGLPRTLADDNQDHLRPYLVLIRPENLFFGHRQFIDGVEFVDHVRIKETIIEVDGWTEVVHNRIRVLTSGHVQIYQEYRDPRTKKITWKLIDEWDTDLDFIPLVTFYSDRQDFLTSKPPLSDLADLNISHWQSSSDQRAVLTVARFPIIAVSGALSDDELTIGPNQWLHCPDPAGRFYYVEHSGKAIESGRKDLLDTEEIMAEYGAVYLKKRPGGASATARALDTAETTSPLQDIAIRFEAAMKQVMQGMARWLKLPDAGTFSINLDFDQDEYNESAAVALGAARLNQDLSRDRYLAELHRMKILGPDFNPDDNDKEIAAEQKADLKQQVKEASAMQKFAPKPAAPAAKKPASTKPASGGK